MSNDVSGLTYGRIISRLPLAIQAYLFEQSSQFIKAKLLNGTYEATCMALERVLCDNRIKELRLSSKSLASAIDQTPRWTFLQAALPHVIHGCSQLLSNRAQLGITDKLPVPVIKLVYTFHWILLQGAEACFLLNSEVEWPLETLELFIKLMVPCAENVHEEDLTFSLEPGLRIWEPLWHYLPPAIPSFCQKVPLPSSSNALLALDAALDDNDDDVERLKLRAHIFDVAVLRGLSTGDMSEEAISWSLAYILRYLLDLMDLKGIQLHDVQQSKVRNYNTAKKQASYQRSVSLLSNLKKERHPSEGVHSADEIDFEHSAHHRLLVLHRWIAISGHLDYVCILKAVIRVLNIGISRVMGENITLILLCLVELGVYQTSTSNVDVTSFELVLDAFVKTITMLGCEYGCGHGVRGQRGESLRHFMHTYLKRLLDLEPQLCQSWFASLVHKTDMLLFFSFLHGFCGYCDGDTENKRPSTPVNPIEVSYRGSVTDIAVTVQLNAIIYRETKMENGNLILKWTAGILFEKLVQNETVPQFTLDEASRFSRYLQTHHERVFRGLIMDGFSSAFANTSSGSKHGNSTSKADSTSTTPAKSPIISTYSSPRARRQVLTKLHGKGSVNESEISRLPFKPMLGMLKKGFQDALSDNDGFDMDESISKSSKDQMTWKDRFMRKRQGRQKLDSAVYDDQDDTDVLKTALSNLNQKRLVNFHGLHQGMLKLRVLLEISAPGAVPDATVIAATLNLQAPVVARASFLIECANFVCSCRKGDWPTYFKLITNVKNKDSVYRAMTQVQQMKHEAAEIFYNWGLVLGEKLESILITEQLDLQKPGGLSRRYYNHDSSFILQGSKNSISSNCPNSLKYAACLLLLEITTFLRETYPLLRTFTRERCSTVASQGNITPTLGNKVHTLLQIPGKKGKVKSPGSRSATLNAGASSSQEEVPEKSTKIKRKPSLFSLHQHSVNTSPLSNRKQSRGISRPESRMLGVASFGQASFDSSQEDDLDEGKDLSWNFAWIGGVVSFLRSVSFLCTHQNRCVDSCVLSHGRCVGKLTESILRVYNDSNHDETETGEQSQMEAGEDKENKEDAIIKYIQTQGNGLLHIPFSLLCKSALVLDSKVLMDVLPAAWELLDHVNNQLVSSAACIFLFAGVVLDSHITEFISKELHCNDPADQMRALKKFDVLWNTRHHVWKRLEENAIQMIKIPPMKVDYTLPSPMIGGDSAYVPDCPWLAGSPFPMETEEVEHADRYLYHLDREKHKIIKAKKRAESLEQQRSAFPLKTIPFSRDADVEYHGIEEDEAVSKPMYQELDFFPPAVAFVVPDLINLLDNSSLDEYGNQVGDVALGIVWRCIVNDPTMFFRFFFEKITIHHMQKSLILILRKLLFHVPKLPAYAATTLFNHLVGIIMYHTRHTTADSSEQIAALAGILWQVSPSVPNLNLKDMKQSLKKEYCETAFLATANFAGAKSLVVAPSLKMDVHEGFSITSVLKPGDAIVLTHSATSTPLSQIITSCSKTIGIETTFRDLVAFYCRQTSIPCEETHFFVDKQSGHILEPNSFVRDIYAHKRGYPPPVVRFEHLDEHISYQRRQLQLFLKKLADIGRMLLINEMFHSRPTKKHLSFLVSELLKQNSFPRRAIELEFELVNEGRLGKEIVALDVTLKDIWVKFICSLLEKMPGLTTWNDELQFFLDVINGALLLHCEDVIVLRTCLVSYINLSLHFSKYFSINGYQRILPAIFRVYGQHQDNNFVKEAIEFAVKQFYVVHQIPFLMQLFACVSPLVDIESVDTIPDEYGIDLVPGKCLYLLLRSLEKEKDDALDILVAVNCEKPLKPYDDFYANRPEAETSLIDVSLRLAITVIAYDPESPRANEMLVALCTILPNYLHEIAVVADKEVDVMEATKLELHHLKRARTYMQTIIIHNEHLCSSFQFEDVGGSKESLDSTKSVPAALIRSWWDRALTNVTSVFRSTSKRSISEKFESLSMVGDEENPFYSRALSMTERDSLDNYYIPRMMLLYSASDFITHWTQRIEIIKSRAPDRYSFPEVFDEDHCSILVTIANVLLRLSFDDQEVLNNSGLRRFFLMALPVIDWSDERQYALLDVVERVYKIFSKILSRPDFVKFANWDALEIYIRGIALTVTKSKHLASRREVRTLLSVCIQLAIGDFPSHWEETRPTASGIPSVTVSYLFQTTVVKFAAKLLHIDGGHYGLRNLCSGYPEDTNVPRLTSFLLHWLLPLCLRLGTNRPDQPSLPDHDVTYALEIILSCLNAKHSKSKNKYESFVLIGVDAVIAPLSGTSIKAMKGGQRLLGLHRIAFLGLKILLSAYGSSLGTSWNKISRKVAAFAKWNPKSEPLWDFVHFVVFHRFPLHLHLLPLVCVVMQKNDEKQVSPSISPPCSILAKRTRIERDIGKPPVSEPSLTVLQNLLQNLTELSHPGKNVLSPRQVIKQTITLDPVPRRIRKSKDIKEDELLSLRLDRLSEHPEEDEEDEDEIVEKVFSTNTGDKSQDRKSSIIQRDAKEISTLQRDRLKKRVSFTDNFQDRKVSNILPKRQISLDLDPRTITRQTEVDISTDSSRHSDTDRDQSAYETSAAPMEKQKGYLHKRRHVIRSRKQHHPQQLGEKSQQAADAFKKKLATFSESLSDDETEPCRPITVKDKRISFARADEGFLGSTEDNEQELSFDDDNYSSAAELLQDKSMLTAPKQRQSNGHSPIQMSNMFFKPPSSTDKDNG